MPRFPITLAAALALAACGAAPPAEPKVAQAANGDVVVDYRSGCAMIYAETGELLASGRDCSFDERQDAEGHFRSWRLDNPGKPPA
jgi:hypothetical protein